jgi:hypothetical protein
MLLHTCAYDSLALPPEHPRNKEHTQSPGLGFSTPFTTKENQNPLRKRMTSGLRQGK